MSNVNRTQNLGLAPLCPLKSLPRSLFSSFLIIVTPRHRETQMKGNIANRTPFLLLSRTLTEAHWWYLAPMYAVPLGCGLTPPGLMKAEAEIHPFWLSIFPSHLCQLFAGTHSRFCRISRQASSKEYSGIQIRVREPSNLKDLKCHYMPTTATWPSGCPASPEQCHIPRQPIPYLASSDF